MRGESFKLALMTNGPSDNIKLWSGTPYRLMESFGAMPDVELRTFSYRISRVWRSMCARLFFRRREFILGGCNDPWYYPFVHAKCSRLCARNADQDVFLFVGDCSVPDRHYGHALYAAYVDNTPFVYFPYLKGKAFWRSRYEKYFLEHERHDLACCDLIFTQNEWVRSFYIDHLNLPQSKVHNVGFGVNLEPYSGEKDYSQERLLIVLRRGTEHYKGLDLLLDAFELLKKKRPQATLSVVGTTAREIAGVSYYEGFPRSKTVELFQRSTLYVMPALREPNGITYLEALANRSPIVGLNRFAFPEFSGYGKWGFSVQNEDPVELANTLNEALSDKERLRAMGEAGQRFVVDRYDWHKVCRNMIDIMHRYDQRSVE